MPTAADTTTPVGSTRARRRADKARGDYQGLGTPAQAVALATLCAVLFLTFLDNTVVSVALADVQSGLHTGVTSLQWVVNGYALAFAGLMLAGGNLGDLFGRKKIMLGGVGVFCAGSVVCAMAPNVPPSSSAGWSWAWVRRPRSPARSRSSAMCTPKPGPGPMPSASGPPSRGWPWPSDR